MISSSVVQILLYVSIGWASLLHPYYVSIFQLTHNPEKKSLQITCKIFTDNLEEAIQEQGTEQLRLGSEREFVKADRYIARYIQQHFDVFVNGEKRSMKYLGKEVELDVTWCYLEITGVPSIDSLGVKNTILFEEYRSQSNIVHTKVGNQKKSAILQREKPEHTFVYQKE